MPDIIITPGSGLIDFYPSNKTASIFTSGNDLAFANPSGNFEFISGNIGIGTTTPSGKLTVVGSGIFTTLTTGLLPNALLHAYSAVSGDTVLNVEGTNGSLFSIVDSLSGTLMAVNNSAGLPVFEVFSDDSIVAGRFNQNDFVISSGGNVGIGTASPVSKLQVSGLITANSGNFTNSLQLNGTGVSISGHTHTTSDVTNFNTSVSGLIFDGSITGVVNENFLVYNSGNGLWKPTTGLTYSSGSMGITNTNGLFYAANIVPANGSRNSPVLNTSYFRLGFGASLQFVNAGNAGSIGVDTEIIRESGGILAQRSSSALTTFGSSLGQSYRLYNTTANFTNSFERLNLGWLNNTARIDVQTGTVSGVPRDLIISTSGASIIITASGNVGIGTTSPTYQLHVNGSGYFASGLAISGSLTVNGVEITSGGGGGVVINNSGDNRVLTSTGSSSGINAESNLTFDGTTLGVTGNASIGQIIIENNIVRSTSGNLFLMPLGALAGSSYTTSGAIIAASGGDARGIGAVDLQMNRLSNDQVASAQYSAILAGSRNKISSNSTYSAILAGSTNAVSGSQYSCVGGSTNTVTSASYGFVFGNLNTCKSSTCTIFSDRNTIQSTYQASILGGQYNSISGLNVDQSYGWSVICAGYNNSIKAAYSNFIGGGIFNTIDALDGVSNSNFSSAITAGDYNTTSSTNTFIGGGDYNTISASGGRSVIVGGNTNAITASTYSAIGGGKENVIAAHYSHIPGGYQAKTVLHAEQSHSAGKFENVGDAQHTVLIARKTTTDNTANQVLFLDDSSARLTVPAKTTWTFQIKLSAYNDTDSAAAGWIYRGVIKRDGSNNTSLVGSIVEENWKDTAMSSTTSSVVADDTNEALEIRVTGLTGKNIRWVAVIDISQVSYGAI